MHSSEDEFVHSISNRRVNTEQLSEPRTKNLTEADDAADFSLSTAQWTDIFLSLVCAGINSVGYAK